MANELLAALRRDIDDYHDRLNVALPAIENKAKQQSLWGKFLKVGTIFLGALLATREVAERIFVNAESLHVRVYRRERSLEEG